MTQEWHQKLPPLMIYKDLLVVKMWHWYTKVSRMTLHSLALKIVGGFFSQRCILCCTIFTKVLGNAACPEYRSWWCDTPFPYRRVASVVWMFCTTRILGSFILKNAFVQFSCIKISEAQWRKLRKLASEILRKFYLSPFGLFIFF